MVVAARAELGFQRVPQLSQQGLEGAEPLRHLRQLIQTVLNGLEPLADQTCDVLLGPPERGRFVLGLFRLAA